MRNRTKLMYEDRQVFENPKNAALLQEIRKHGFTQFDFQVSVKKSNSTEMSRILFIYNYSTPITGVSNRQNCSSLFFKETSILLHISITFLQISSANFCFHALVVDKCVLFKLQVHKDAQIIGHRYVIAFQIIHQAHQLVLDFWKKSAIGHFKW